MRIVTCSQMKEAEAYAMDSGISALRLMENAGSAAARFIRNTIQLSGLQCTIVCGKGNNGGDGLVVARRLLDTGADITVILACGSPQTTDASEMLERLNGLRVRILDYTKDQRTCIWQLQRSNVIIDGVFGTGFSGDVKGSLAELFKKINSTEAQIFALDMPSGANADSGKSSDVCIRASFTITFGASKVGQFIAPASDYCGKIIVVNIGLPEGSFSDTGAVELLDYNMIKSWIPKRAKNSNKGTYGRVVTVCGSTGMSGAAYMSAAGAARVGAGLVSVCAPASIADILAVKFNEIMVTPVAATDKGTLGMSGLDTILEMSLKARAMVIGCGLSRNEETAELVRRLIDRINCPVVLDADGINAFEGHINVLRDSSSDLILTPHPGEMARLTGKSIAQIQGDRIGVASAFAKENGVTLVLKGSDTVIALKDGRVFINPTGNPGMAKGGSGDILAGMIAGFSAQGFQAETAACCGVYIHGYAGDRSAKNHSQYGMLPTDMLLEIPQIFREMSR